MWFGVVRCFGEMFPRNRGSPAACMAKGAVPRDKIRPTEGRRARGGSLRFASYLVDWVSILSSEIAVSQLPSPPARLRLENPQNAEASPRFSSAQRDVPSLRSEKAVEWLRALGLCSQTSAVWSDAPSLRSEEAVACLVRCTCEISPIGPSSCIERAAYSSQCAALFCMWAVGF